MGHLKENQKVVNNLDQILSKRKRTNLRTHSKVQMIQTQIPLRNQEIPLLMR
jgi:hypothetical protein